ncbi:MAG: hypothetical protein NXI16_01055 [Alphaproteobacteria bacterium]|nr:hypothetical protein [Alphaproteobacteria bacterium]
MGLFNFKALDEKIGRGVEIAFFKVDPKEPLTMWSNSWDDTDLPQSAAPVEAKAPVKADSTGGSDADKATDKTADKTADKAA